MPSIQRSDIPEPLLRHLATRIRERDIDANALKALAEWLDTEPIVPEGDWFHRLPAMTVCGRGAYIVTFLRPRQTPIGEEV